MVNGSKDPLTGNKTPPQSMLISILNNKLLSITNSKIRLAQKIDINVVGFRSSSFNIDF